jgi:hypothetical protein
MNQVIESLVDIFFLHSPEQRNLHAFKSRNNSDGSQRYIFYIKYTIRYTFY